MFDRRGRRLKKLSLPELAHLAGDDWTTTWRKLRVTPRRYGQVIVAELSVDGVQIQPIYAQLGYSERADVVRALGRAFGLAEEHAVEFLTCTRDFSDLVASAEAALVLYSEDLDRELEQ
jgi:hypothetical protein